MLAGRKLLLADDSITIQKVVQLTFADEGVTVVVVSNGKEAIERLEEVAPDIVLADVFMPLTNGYEVCEYIKQNAQLKHIPVMLLVGSFEPFEEAEARRVGADEILTKPFQSIRRLIDKVGGLVSGKPASDEVSTAELPKVEAAPSDTEKLSASELEIATADTQPLHVGEVPLDRSPAAADAPALRPDGKIEDQSEETMDNEMMQSNSSNAQVESLQDGDVLLDLGDIGPAAATSVDFVLDIDLNDLPHGPPVEVNSSRHQSFPESPFSQPQVGSWGSEAEARITDPATSSAVRSDRMPATQGLMGDDVFPAASDTSEEFKPRYATAELEVNEASSKAHSETLPGGQIDPNQLSREIIDAIARRAVEQLSEKVVQEIAWEVVPQLAELLIKRKLEKDSQAN